MNQDTKDESIMKSSGTAMRRVVAGIGAGALFGGLAAATVAAPTAGAAPAVFLPLVLRRVDDGWE